MRQKKQAQLRLLVSALEKAAVLSQKVGLIAEDIDLQITDDEQWKALIASFQSLERISLDLEEASKQCLDEKQSLDVAIFAALTDRVSIVLKDLAPYAEQAKQQVSSNGNIFSCKLI